MTDIFTIKVRDIVSRIPPGKTMTYGMIAAFAGNSGGARQVVRVLSSSSEKYNLPWHRVINRKGEVPPRRSMGHLFQKQLLEEEGVLFNQEDKVDLSKYSWFPRWEV